MIELLLALILALTGIGRTADPALMQIAEARADETNTDATFNHSGMRPGTWEVLAWNLGYDDLETSARRAAEQWQGSASHWDILTNADLTRIGCGHSIGPDGRNNFACVLQPGAAAPAPPTAPPAPVVPGPSEPPVVLLPNTSMSP